MKKKIISILMMALCLLAMYQIIEKNGHVANVIPYEIVPRVKSEVDINEYIPQGATALSASVAEVYQNRQAIATIVSDDGVYSSGLLMDELTQEYGISATVAGAEWLVKDYVDEWKEMMSHGYIDLVSHSQDHVRMAEDTVYAKYESAMIEQIVNADSWYEENFGIPQIVFVSPNYEMCQKGYKVMYENDFWANRQGTYGFNSLNPADGSKPGEWYNLNAIEIGDDSVSLETRNSWVDEVISERSWLIEAWHNICETQEEKAGNYQAILKEDAALHMSYLSQKQEEGLLWVASLTDATKYLREKAAATPIAYVEDGTLCVEVLLDSYLPAEEFDFPLTVLVELPEGVEIKSFTEEIRDTAQMVEIDGKQYVQCDVEVK